MSESNTIFDDLENEKTNYYIGLFSGLGCLNKKKSFIVSVTKKHEDLAVKIAQDINSNKPLRFSKREDGRQNNILVEIYGLNIINKLYELELQKSSSVRVSFPKQEHYSNNFLKDFIRGYFDAKGEIDIRYKIDDSANLVVSINGHQNFCGTLKDIISEKLNIEIFSRIVSLKASTVKLMIENTQGALKFINWLYEGANIYSNDNIKRYNEAKEIHTRRNLF
jgi:hypothetical protein